MAEISIPGVSDKYKTSSYIDALMQKERIPLTREQESVDRYKEQQGAWRGINQKMVSLRDSTKTLYSFENPFNNKLASSSDERAITAEAGREASYESIKIDVVKQATSDRFLSSEIEKSAQIPKGKYTFQVADKTISFNWKGGKLSDFVTSLNKRSSNTIKVSLVGVSNGKSSLLVESLKTGSDSRLVFKDDALTFALESGLVEKSKDGITDFGDKLSDFTIPPQESEIPQIEQEGLPSFTMDKVSFDEEKKRTIIPPRNGIEIKFSDEIKNTESARIDFSYKTDEVIDITEELNIKRTMRPELPEVGVVNFEEITIQNEPSETLLPPIPPDPFLPITSHADFYVRTADGSEHQISTEDITEDAATGEKNVSVSLKNYPEADSLIVRNRNTGDEIQLSPISFYDEKKSLGYSPINAVSEAGDAVIKYEGITITRPTNKIDDVIPHVTLNVHNPTEKTATIDIEPDKESAKDALIEFVGNYNQVIAEMNILSENKPEIVSELDYLSPDEAEAASKRLGMFQNDFSLTNGKSTLRGIISANYNWSPTATVTMLNQLGISSRAAGGTGGYSAAQMRGYLEIDEKKLDSALDGNLDEIKNIFGYDSDGDLVVDSGIGFALDRQLSSWVQSGGLIASKTSGIDTKIKASENKIRKLESQLATKEMQLRSKYGQMEGTLNNLNAQSNTLSSFANNGKQ